MSEDIPLSVSESEIVGDTVVIKTNHLFNIEKFIDSSKEKFTFELLYVFSPSPVHAVLKEYMMRGTTPWKDTECREAYQPVQSKSIKLFCENFREYGAVTVTYQCNA
jgi:hypothetical protein